MYTEYQPHILLKPYVDVYWHFDAFIADEMSIKVLPDGCIDIILSLSDSTDMRLVGTITSCLDLLYNRGRYSQFGIRFRPAAFTAFMNMPIDEVTNRNLEAETLKSTLFNADFQDELLNKKTVADKVNYIDSHILAALPSVFSPDRQIIHSVDLIQNSRGLLPLPQIADKICLSPRQFERRFKTSVGVSPKTYSKIVRFRNAVKHIKSSDTKDSLYDIAVDCGYYDHSHLTKEFKELAKVSPAYFRQSE